MRILTPLRLLTTTGEKGEGYEDIKGYCKSATIEEIQKHKHVLKHQGVMLVSPMKKMMELPF
jgi:hypothetical protein